MRNWETRTIAYNNMIGALIFYRVYQTGIVGCHMICSSRVGVPMMIIWGRGDTHYSKRLGKVICLEEILMVEEHLHQYSYTDPDHEDDDDGSGLSSKGVRGALLFEVCTNRAGFTNLYQEALILTFKSLKIQGSQNIVAKLTSLPIQQCKHAISTVDCQPSDLVGSMHIFVSGNIQFTGEQHSLSSVRCSI
ncbi:hypothetical protein HHK36_020567 [Tetracentron sinense]|uniref:NTF2 domain-containing protein n=1 Tax=Tetracentron sinense TaxID=13715 RepID=A0A834YRU2_TETSI|nr:hypothetical protein HHK36_020567 [Tetracentron sinense]